MLYDGTVPPSREFAVRAPLVAVLLCSAAALAGEPVPLTKDGSFKQHLQWSPDGSRFLFTRIHEGKMALWTMAVDGGDLKKLVGKDAPNFDGHWSADGKRIVFVLDVLQGSDGKLQIDSVN